MVDQLETETEYIVEDGGFLIQIAVKDHPVLQTTNRIRIFRVAREFGAITFADQRKGRPRAIYFIVAFSVQVFAELRNCGILKKLLQREVEPLLLSLRQDLNASD